MAVEFLVGNNFLGIFSTQHPLTYNPALETFHVIQISFLVRRGVVHEICFFSPPLSSCPFLLYPSPLSFRLGSSLLWFWSFMPRYLSECIMFTLCWTPCESFQSTTIYPLTFEKFLMLFFCQYLAFIFSTFYLEITSGKLWINFLIFLLTSL